MQAYKFTCPSCGKVARIHEVTHCDGAQSEIAGFAKEGESYGCQYIDTFGIGDVFDVTFHCSECGAEIGVSTREDLVELGYVQLYDHPPIPESLPPGFSATERGNNLLARGMDILGYYDCGPDTWIEVSYCPENYPATSVSIVTMTNAELLAHCNKAIAEDGWEWVKNNLE